jgi:putative endonuclease
MKYYVYAIKSTSRNYIYVGITGDIIRRVSEHNRGKERTTRPYLPFILIYNKVFDSRKEARIHEIKMKSGHGKELLKGL